MWGENILGVFLPTKVKMILSFNIILCQYFLYLALKGGICLEKQDKIEEINKLLKEIQDEKVLKFIYTFIKELLKE